MNKISLFKYVIAAMLCLNSALFAMETGQNQPAAKPADVLFKSETGDSAKKAQNKSIFRKAVSKVTETFKSGVNFVKNNPTTCLAIAALIETVVCFYLLHALKPAPKPPAPSPDTEDSLDEPWYTVKDSNGCPGTPAFGKCLNQVKQENKTRCEKWNLTDPNNNKICLPANPKKEDCLSPHNFCKLIRAKDEISSKCYPDGEKNNLTFNQLAKLKNGYCTDKFAQATAAEIFQKARIWCCQGNNAEQTVQKFNQSICRYLKNATKESGIGSSINKYKKMSEAYGCNYLDKCYSNVRNNE